MKKRVFVLLFTITCSAIFLYMLFLDSKIYNGLLDENKTSLATYMMQYNEFDYSLDINGANRLSDDLNGCRVSFIDLNGNYIADSQNYSGSANFEEVSNAINNNEAYVIRKDDSGKKNLFYCVKFDTYLVRISMPINTFSNVFLNTLPSFFVFLIIDWLVCIILANEIVKRILNSVEDLERKNILGKEIELKYSELEPLVNIMEYNNGIINNKINKIKEDKRIESVVLNNMEHGIVILNNDLSIAIINNSASVLLNWHPDEKKVLYFNNDNEIKKALEENEDRLFYRNFKNKEYALRYTNSDNFKVILMTDVTEIKKLERSKNDFIANVTHEMNTPLTSIRGFAEMMSNKSLPNDKIEHAANVILKQTNRLSLLIKDIINYSAIQTANLPLYEVNVSEICKSIVLSLEKAIDDKNIKVTLDIDDNIKINSRTEIVVQVISNLVSNAIKYNKDNGEIVISLKKDNDVILIVKDSGIGIDEADVDKIFDRFFTVDKSHNHYSSGFGLGLAIVKKIVNESNWDIYVDSKKDEGTCFTVKMR